MKKNLKDNIKFVLGIIVGILLSGTTVYAAILYASSDVSYDNTNSGLSATNVQSALDELYSKTPQTPFKLGDYFTLVPTATSYSIKGSITGYTSDQTINPSELTLWRVIDIHSDGSVDAISDYTSSVDVYFQGKVGYINYIGTMQTIAQQYSKTGYTINTRMMGYGGQTSTITNTSSFYDDSITVAPSTTSTPSPTTGEGQEYSEGALGDTLYLKDYLLVKKVYQTLTANKVGDSSSTIYWIASRKFANIYGDNQSFSWGLRVINTSGELTSYSVRSKVGILKDVSQARPVRPIITLKSNTMISSGNGTKNNPYILQ